MTMMTEDDLAAEADRLRTVWWDSILVGGPAMDDAWEAYDAAYRAWRAVHEERQDREARTQFLLHASGETEP